MLLPLFALVVLSTLFLFSRSIDRTRSFPYSGAGVPADTGQQRVGNPSYRALGSDGSAITLTAERATVDSENPDRAISFGVQGRIELPSGLTYDVTSGRGTFDQTASVARLDGGVTILTSDGYHIESEEMIATLSAGKLETTGQVTARGPLGNLTAGKMTIERQADAPPGASYVLVFQKGVKLVYTPKNDNGN